MDFINMTLAVSQPTGMWETIINWLNSSVGNYALAIILITVAVKLLMLPLDFYQRYVTKVNARKQAVVQPQIDAVKRKYQNNPDMVNKKTMEIYKKEKLSMGGTCVGLLLNMGVSMIVFFTLFNGLNAMANFKIDQEYRTLESTYTQVITETMGDDTQESNPDLYVTATENANKQVLLKYDEVKNSFLWIKNVWIADSSSKAVFSYDDFLSKTGQKSEDVSKETYETVMAPIIEKYGEDWNGYYILVILSAVVTFLSLQANTWVSKFRAKRKGQVFVDPNGSNKIMMWIMPVIMAVFTLFYNAVFAIYIVAGSMFSLISSPIVTILVEKLDERNSSKSSKNRSDKSRPAYSRENLF